jgi:elongation factor Ts
MTVTAQMVKELREATGASILDCKNALEEYEGDLEKARQYLAKKGLAIAEKKAGREAREGLVETYTHHGGRVGVMLELNCETDFVANTDLFKTLAHDLALHVAFASPLYLNVDSVPENVVAAQQEVFRAEASAQGKPDDIVEKIVEGRMNKFYGEVVFMNQPFVKDEDVIVGDMITQAIAELKENIQVRRFTRYELGGGSPAGSDGDA